MYIIGKSNIYYTLWIVTPSLITDENNVPLYNQYTYLKNISTSRDKAHTMYPELNIDETIHGHSTFVKWNSKPSVKENNIVVDEFQFGKYYGRKIDDVMKSDMNYVLWYYDALRLDDAHKAFVQACLINTGKYCISNGMLITIEEAARMAEAAEKDLETFTNATNGETLDIVTDITMGYDSTIDIEDSTHACIYGLNGRGSKVCIAFKSFKTMYYNGYAYYLPVLNTGKCARYKKHHIMITKYHIAQHNNYLVIVVDEFSIHQ
jgi:hypothetical protein